MKIFHRYWRRWHHVNAQIRSLACTILVISLTTSSCIFIFAFSIYKQHLIEHIEIVKEISNLHMIGYQWEIHPPDDQDITRVIEDIYLSISSIKYLMLVDASDRTPHLFPENLTLNLQMLNTNTSPLNYQSEISNYRLISNIPIFNLYLPILHNKHGFSCLCIGIIYRYNVSTIISLLCSISSILFIVIWLTSILTVIFNSWINRSSIQKLSQAMHHIMSGNFNRRIEPKSNGALEGLMLEFNEMAERLEYYEKKNIQQLILEKAKLETLVSIMADGALLLDKDLRIIFINKSALQTFTFLKSCITGTYIYDYFPSYINKQLLPILNQIVKDNYNTKSGLQSCDFSLHLNNDISKTFQFIITTVLDQEHDVITGIGIIIKDITSQIGLNEAKAQFISNVSHELRTPLFNIRSFLETLSEYKHSLSEQQQVEFLEIASQETQRLTHLVNDVLDLSRLESDFLDSMDVVELYDIIPPIIQTSQLRANQNYLHLLFKISSNVFPVSGYNHLLVQVLSNLIGNSLKFTPIDGRIFIKIYPIAKSHDLSTGQVKKIRVEIIDEGTGIKEFDQARIYDRFVRLEDNVHTLEGTGLGLSIVKNIISKHKSNILLYSEFGLGSSFWFDLYLLEKKN
uniref:Drug sensory protein A n=1 Tax=Rhodochorton tenue TaxID=173034 RepID=UPI002A82BB92|nr:Drug sensory protein A [Rhodochorton tenue]WOK79571.1 Drug sensory protein A [Rhodochorton tenue]